MAAISISEFRDRAVAKHLAQGHQPPTVRQVVQVLRELGAVGVRLTTDIASDSIGRWLLAWPARTPVTFQSHLRCLSSLCTFAVANKWLDVDPFDVDAPEDWIRADSRPPAPRRRYSRPADQIRRVGVQADREACTGSWECGRTQAFFWALFLTGERPGALLRARLVDYNSRQKVLRIVPHWVTGRGGSKTWWRPKTESSGPRAVGDRLGEILDRWHPRTGCEWLFPGARRLGPWIHGSNGKRPLDYIRALGERAGVHGLTCKAARKGLVTYAPAIGLSELERRRLTMHTTADVADDWYDELEVGAMRPAAAKIELFIFGSAV